MTTLLILSGIVAGYLLPVLIAASRNHPSAWGIGIVNVLLGWTILGWIVALAWAASGRPPRQADRDGNRFFEWQPDETRREYEERTARYRR